MGNQKLLSENVADPNLFTLLTNFIGQWRTRHNFGTCVRQISKSGCKNTSAKNLSVRQKFHNSLNIKTLGLGMGAHALSLFPVPLPTAGSYGNVE